MQTHSYSVCTGVPPLPRPLFSLFVQVRWCLLVLSFSFVFLLFLFFFLLVQPFYKRPCVCGSASWNVHVSWWCFSRCAHPRLLPPRRECVSASWITFENKTTDSHISGIHVLVCFVSFFFSPLHLRLLFVSFKAGLRYLASFYLCLFVRDPYHTFYQGGYQLVVHPQSVMLQVFFF